MKQYKEFQGKNLDEAIQEACAYFGVAREKLEIDILNDAKGGIFGLMGMKKACVRAARARLGETDANAPEEESRPARPEKAVPDRPPKAERGKESADRAPKAERGKESADRPPKAERGKGRNGRIGPGIDEKSPRPKPAGRSAALAEAGALLPEQGRNSAKTAPKTPPSALEPEAASLPDTGASFPDTGAAIPGPGAALPGPGAALPGPGAPAFDPNAPGVAAPPEGSDESGRDGLPEFDLENGDLQLLRRTVCEVVLRLAQPIVGEASCEVRVSGKRVRAVLECGEAAGLLVGRDGQTLAAVQYLAARIISRQLGASVHLHIDAGHYRERQDDKLRELALALAEKARQSGRAQSTRPLSAYQRRVIHLALENDAQVYTRSKGDGAQRRVVILLKRARPDEAGPGRPPETDAAGTAGPGRPPETDAAGTAGPERDLADGSGAKAGRSGPQEDPRA